MTDDRAMVVSGHDNDNVIITGKQPGLRNKTANLLASSFVGNSQRLQESGLIRILIRPTPCLTFIRILIKVVGNSNKGQQELSESYPSKELKKLTVLEKTFPGTKLLKLSTLPTHRTGGIVPPLPRLGQVEL